MSSSSGSASSPAREQLAADVIRDYARHLKTVLDGLPIDAIADAMTRIGEARDRGALVFIAGNGGSASTASHMANDLAKGVAKGGARPVRAIALSDNVPLITAIANDESYERSFSGQLEALARPHDVLVVISVSGRSPNILHAIESARRMEVRTIGFLGMGGGPAAALVDVPVVIPSDDYGRVEDVHLTLDHMVTEFLRYRIP